MCAVKHPESVMEIRRGPAIEGRAGEVQQGPLPALKGLEYLEKASQKR